MKPLCPHFQVVLFVCKILQNEICEFLLNFRFWPHLALTGFDISIVIIVIIITHRFFDLKLCMCSNKYPGPVVRRPISANPGLNCNPGLLFFSSKAFSRTIFPILFRVANHQIVDKNN